MEWHHLLQAVIIFRNVPSNYVVRMRVGDGSVRFPKLRSRRCVLRVAAAFRRCARCLRVVACAELHAHLFICAVLRHFVRAVLRCVPGFGALGCSCLPYT